MDNNIAQPVKRTWLKWLLITGLLVGLGLGGGAFYFYRLAFGQNIPTLETDKVLIIPENVQQSEQLAELLLTEKLILDKGSFIWTANYLKFKPRPNSRFKIPKTTQSNRELIRVLGGKQLTVKLTFHNIRTKEQLAGLLARQMQTDSLAFLAAFTDPAWLSTHQLSPETLMSIFIPNTYEVYWNTTPQEVLEKMLAEHKKFWTTERLAKAKALNLSPVQVYTLASIVETESQHKSERSRIAGVYLNRLKQGWKLEADPTVVFAVGDFEIRRVLKSHLETVSPYNTYLNTGLPPGPIYMSSIDAIDAVLNPETHEYMFFCAKPDLSGAHAFAKTLSAHNQNAKEYHRAISNR
jgi:UPF0755 protein